MKKIIPLIPFLLVIPLVLAQYNQTSQEIIIPIFGKINAEIPLPILGIILGFIDGAFNPCALSVLFFLVAYLMALGSRKKCLVIGLTYSLMVFIVYFSFMYGILSIITQIGYLETIKMIVGVILILAGIIELKDFFFYGKWFSLEIPKFSKPTIERLIKMATIPSAILLGLFVSIVEIPCAGAFPFFYLTILADKASGIMNTVYLLWYNLFFVIPLVILTFIFYLGLLKVERAEKTRLEKRKYMRLVAGLIMILLGLAMLFKMI